MSESRDSSDRRRVFLSHSSKDRAFVLRIVTFLRQNKIGFWYSESHLRGAQQWHDEIGRALAKCNWLLLVLSPNAIRSPWVKRELLYALEQRRYNEKIIPLLYKPCKYARLSWTLSGFQMIDFTDDFDTACQQLLRVWESPHRPKPRRRPSRTNQKRP